MLTIDRAQLVMEMLGMNLKEGKALLEGVHGLMIAHQVNEYLKQHRLCPVCGKRHTSKDFGVTPVRQYSDRES